MGLTTDPTDPGLREHREDGQQQVYLVLSDEERAKGFVRPVRYKYKHLKCGGVTTMGQALCETYARDPKFYSGTFCCQCGKHFQLKELGPVQEPDGNRVAEWQFEWQPDGDPVGSDAEQAEMYLREKGRQKKFKEELDAISGMGALGRKCTKCGATMAHYRLRGYQCTNPSCGGES